MRKIVFLLIAIAIILGRAFADTDLGGAYQLQAQTDTPVNNSDSLLKQKKEGGVSPEKAAALCVFLASGDSDGLSGKLLSAAWDKWEGWSKDDIRRMMASDVFTLRRINP